MSEKEFDYWWENIMDCESEVIDDTYFKKRFYMEDVEWWEDEVFEKIKRAIEQ